MSLESERMAALEQLIREYRQLVRESDPRNAVVIVHADATLDQLERRASELIGA
jgi:DnaJ-domain-containing protein 1